MRKILKTLRKKKSIWTLITAIATIALIASSVAPAFFSGL